MYNLEDNEIEVRQPEKQVKEGVEGVNNKVLQPHFCSLIIGVPGSGKSHLLFELVKNPNLYFKKFDYVFIISQSKIPGLECGKVNWINNVDMDWIFSRLNLIDKQKKPKQQVLIIFDDVIAELRKLQYEKDLKRLFFNRRHLLGEEGIISIIVTTQRYMVTPPVIRTVLTSLYIFKMNRKEWLTIKNEHLFALPPQVEFVLKDIFAEPHSFFYYRIDNSQMYFNFKTIKL